MQIVTKLQKYVTGANGRNSLIWTVIVFFFGIFVWGNTASAKEPERVRVGVFDFQAFYGVDGNGAPYGYGYEYLEILERYADLRYEYVYGSWAECLEWLENGQIDMLDSSQRNETREEAFLFSQYSTGTSYGELYVRAEDSSISYNDFKSMDGLTVGMLEQSSRNDTFLNFAEENNFSVKTVMYQSAAELSAGLLEKKVDAIVSSNLRQGTGERSVARFSPTPFYMIFNRDKEQLKRRVDAALENILIDYPNFNAGLNEKYYASKNLDPEFTKEERWFLENSPPLRVVCKEDGMPFVSADYGTDKLPGINREVLDQIQQMTGLSFSYSSSFQPDAAALVETGQADLLLNFGTGKQSEESSRLLATDPFLKAALCLVGKSHTIGETPLFAVPESSSDKIGFYQEQFPGASIAILNSNQECYDALEDEQVDYVVDNIYSASHYVGSAVNSELMIAVVFPIEDSHSFGVSNHADPMLMRVLNKAIASISQLEIESIYVRYMTPPKQQRTFEGFFYEYRFLFGMLFFLAVALVFVLTPLILIRCKRQKRMLWEKANLDTLTGIGNRNHFVDKVGILLQKNKDTNYVVCRLDIENFKFLNEIYGFECGDLVIRQVAQMLDFACVPDKDTCARISGDNFIVLKSYVRREENQELLEMCEKKVCEAIRRQYSCVVNFKVGAYYIEDNTEDVFSILEKANYAHSICKSSANIDRFVYDESIKQTAIEERKMESRMEDALLEKQFMLYLQPKYRLEDEALVGAEALVRWSSEHDGQIIAPNSFIPLFERNGFITKLDMYMLERVCELIRSWIDSGETPVTVSVNFSRLHLLNADFTKEICNTVDRYSLPRKYIEIELTESTMFNNEEAMSAVLESLHEEGFTLSMDDFGTGYSSLGLLKNLPVDVIKIDQSFFFDSRFKTRAKAVIENVIQMAKRLDIHTVAEGVENQEHIDLLRELGCEIVQGYYYSRPVPVSEFQLRGVVKRNDLPQREMCIEPWEIGDVERGRGEIGSLMPVFSYRLFQTAVRKMLGSLYGEGEMVAVIRGAGKLAGGLFARQYLDLSLVFDDFLLALSKKMDEMKMGHLRIECLDLETGGGIITISGDLDCSGAIPGHQTLCQYDEGFIAGIFKEYTKKGYSVVETDCWGTGENLCRFEFKPR